jgi:hypothetical protein
MSHPIFRKRGETEEATSTRATRKALDTIGSCRFEISAIQI